MTRLETRSPLTKKNAAQNGSRQFSFPLLEFGREREDSWMGQEEARRGSAYRTGSKVVSSLGAVFA